MGMALLYCITATSQNPDSVKTHSLSEVVVTESLQSLRNKRSSLHIDVVGKDALKQNFTGNLIQALDNIPGVHSMDIGSGFSKPMIRGMGFSRIAVTENGIKQEGQQWGADHGLEIDAFNVEQVNIHKGPLSLLYGSDAMGGIIEITELTPPIENQLFGEVSILGKSVNETLGGSVMLGLKKNSWYTKFRYSQQNFGDYRIPTDSIKYLTIDIPIYDRKLKNTAGIERNANLYTEYRKGSYISNYTISNVYQKTGFFPGAHGIPDFSRVEDDGDSRNIDLPYSKVNHLKISSLQRYILDKIQLQWNIGYQNNHREEWSLFHTHYGDKQPAPEKDPNKELLFSLNTYSSNMQIKHNISELWEYSAGWNLQYQHNSISGYSFLLPRYNRFTTGVFAITTYRPSNALSFSGGIRYDYGKLKASEYLDHYLEAYLAENNYNEEMIAENKWRSYAVNRNFGDYSLSVGVVWNPEREHLLQANIGRSFRLPGANELAANGVHHGTFRHEKGDPNLSSERGWQADVSYTYEKNGLTVNLSPFASWFNNYIYLKPTGQWSILPHAGQIYQYTGAEALFAGAELSVSIDFLQNLNYRFSGEYVYANNQDEHVALSFSPPATMRNTITWTKNDYSFFTEWQGIAKQNRVANNEDKTSGAQLFHLGASANIRLAGLNFDITLSARNIFDTKYYNHLSFYRKVEIPEPGRSFQLLIKIPLKKLL
jgi:iron complex outermembrane receptor protein